MAQAARLNLRMQKELRLLLTDPPPGASFPSLSATAAAASSLSSIEAQIEGPEGTVYADGFFKLKIQIPDRYPFQPPNVTFATPIYHPNIDTGGRICLDILNLPPKGAWQPSLNISTVLTSIGLLLSEPNPDDGLMHEASQEYKYNRQVFDQKARSMTEKYARIGACEVATVTGQDCQAPSLDSAEAKGSDTSIEEVNQYLGGNKRFCGISRKLSLESSELDREKIVGKSIDEGPSEHSGRELEYKGLKQGSCRMTIGQIQSHHDPQKVSKKLSLEPSTSFHVNKDNDIADLVSVKGKSALRADCLESLPSVQASGSDFEQNYNHDDSRSKQKTVSINSEHSGLELEYKGLKQEPCRATIGEINSHQDPQKMSKKLSLEPSTSFYVNKDYDITDIVSIKEKSTLRTGCSESLPSAKIGSDVEQNFSQYDERSKPKTASIESEKEKLLQPLDSKIGTTDDREKLLSVAKKSSTQHLSSGTSRNRPPSHTDSHHKSKPHSAVVNGDENGLPRLKQKKLGLAGRHFSTGAFLSRQCQGKGKAENQLPTSTSPHVHSSKNLTPSSSLLLVPEASHFRNSNTMDHSSTCSDHSQPLKPLGKLSNMHAVNTKSEMESKVSAAQYASCIDEKQQAKKQKTMAPSVDTDELIVLDSEDSDEDQRATARSKLSLARRRFQGKLKS